MAGKLTRREFTRQFGTISALGAGLGIQLSAQEPVWKKEDHFASGNQGVVTSTSREASAAALKILENGGNAADAYMTAALTQTVVEPGLTSIGGAFGITYFAAASQKTRAITGRLGAAAEEPYDFDRNSPITQTGRAMPVPGFLAGVHLAHREFGSVPWKRIVEPAIRFATQGVAVPAMSVKAAKRKGARFAEGKELWIKDGQFLRPGERLIQKDLGRLLASIAAHGPAAFYEGEFAQKYVERSRTDGGKLQLDDMKKWSELASLKKGEPEGDYRGHQIWAPRAGLLSYALHLNEALDLRASGLSATSPETVFRQVRIMEEVFLSAPEYTAETHDRYASPDYAKKRADFVLNSPLRPVTIDAIFNTCFLAVRDRQGNCAWGTHSINTPTAFGAGILVDGVYAAHAISRKHVYGTGASAPGISTSFALYQDGRPRVIAGSPGFGFVHGPYQVGTGIVEWDLSPIEAMNLPRFGLTGQDGKAPFESHYDPSVFSLLEKRGVPHYSDRPSPKTGLVGAMTIDSDDTVHVVQDGRRPGFAKAR